MNTSPLTRPRKANQTGAILPVVLLLGMGLMIGVAGVVNLGFVQDDLAAADEKRSIRRLPLNSWSITNRSPSARHPEPQAMLDHKTLGTPRARLSPSLPPEHLFSRVPPMPPVVALPLATPFSIVKTACSAKAKKSCTTLGKPSGRLQHRPSTGRHWLRPSKRGTQS